MMINWFVIHNSEHLGPFSQEVLHQLFSEGDIEKDTKVWKEGMKDSVTYEEAFLLKEEELSFKPITKIIEQDSEQEIDDLPDLPPELPPEVLKQNQNLMQQTVENEVDQDEEEKAEAEEVVEEEVDETTKPMALDKPKRRKTTKFTGFILAALLIIVIIPAIYYVNTSVLKFKRPAKMSLSDFARLAETSSDPSSSNKFSFAIAKDKSTLWMSTNNPYSGEVILSLKSVNSKTLSGNTVEVESRGILENKIVKFEDFIFKQGKQIVDGHYEVKVNTVKDLEVPLISKFSESRKKQFRFFEIVLISNLSKENFEKNLYQKTKKLQSNDLEFWKELKQKYKTIQMITLQIQNGLKNVYDNKDKEWKSKVQEFEMDYKMNFGNFFTNFVIANDESYEGLKSKDFSNKTEIISNYTRLSRLAKNIGGQTMGILHDLEAFNPNISPKDYKLARDKSLARLQTIVDTCEQKIQMIQAR